MIKSWFDNVIDWIKDAAAGLLGLFFLALMTPVMLVGILVFTYLDKDQEGAKQ